MLTMMRNMLRSKAAGGLFVLLIIAMAAWGVTDIFAGGSGSGLVSAGDRVVTDRRFDAAVERVLINAEDDQGRSLTKEQALDQGIIDQVFNRQRTEVMLTAYADQLGIAATSQAIDDEIRNTQVFQDDTGLYDSNLYRRVLDSNNIRPDDYRVTVESELTINRLRELPLAGLKAPRLLARFQAAYEGERRRVSYFTLDQNTLPAIEPPTQDELLAIYEDQKSDFVQAERRAISLIRMSPDDFTAVAEVSESDIQATYEAYRQSRYTGPDTRRYTSFRFPDEDTARAALARIAGGAEASQIESAIETSEQTGQKQSLKQPRLSEQVFSPSAQIRSIHGPQNDNGTYLVIRLEEIMPGASMPLALVREEIAEELARAQATNMFYEMLPQFDDLLGTGADLEGIAEALGVPLLSFMPVDASGRSVSGEVYKPLSESAELLSSAFQKSVGQQTERLVDGEVAWLARIDRIVPEETLDYDSVQSELTEIWTAQKQAGQLQVTAREIEQALADGTTSLSAQAAAFNSQVEDFPAALTRKQAAEANIPFQLIETLFNIKSVGDVFTAAGRPGQIFIMQVTEIEAASDATLDQLTDTSLLQLEENLADDLFSAYFAALQQETDVDVNAAALAAYKQSLRLEP